MKAVITEPPSLVGCPNLIVTALSPATADTRVGTVGTVIGRADTVPDLSESPAADLLNTLNVYVLPLVRPVIVHDVVDTAHT